MKEQAASHYSKKNKLFGPSLLLALGIAVLGYYVIFTIIVALFGKEIAAWIAAPLSGLPVFIITKWDMARTQQDSTWREILTKFPKLNYWYIALVFLTILLAHIIFILLLEWFMEVRPDFFAPLPLESGRPINPLDHIALTAITLLLTFTSFFIGGGVAGKLLPYHYLATYSHAAIGAFLAQLSNFLLLWINYGVDYLPASQEDIGLAILASCPNPLFSILGAWVVVRKRGLIMKKTDIPIDKTSVTAQTSPTIIKLKSMKAQSMPRTNKKRKRRK